MIGIPGRIHGKSCIFRNFKRSVSKKMIPPKGNLWQNATDIFRGKEGTKSKGKIADSYREIQDDIDRKTTVFFVDACIKKKISAHFAKSQRYFIISISVKKTEYGCGMTEIYLMKVAPVSSQMFLKARNRSPYASDSEHRIFQMKMKERFIF
ncbi:MAG: hypothetical protein ACLVDZ_00105 [Ruminococcus sp.]